MSYGYGDALDGRIRSDAEILAGLVTQGIATVDYLRTGHEEGEGMPIWKAFTEAGGDDTHSGYSFACVRHAALELLEVKDGEFINPAILHVAKPADMSDQEFNKKFQSALDQVAKEWRENQ